MPRTNYLNFTIGGKQLDVDSIEDVPVTIDYELESDDDFQQKKASTALEITIPATLNNDAILGTFHNPNVDSNLSSSIRDCLISTGGIEIFKGKALIESAKSQNGKPKSYTINCFGNNGDWMLPLQDSTLHDFLSPHTHTLNSATVFNSWYNFNGTSEILDYCYVPVRYLAPFGGEGGNDSVVKVMDLRPSLSIYWILWRAFKSLGYKIDSAFFDTDYFRRLVMPWTWGDFLFMDSTKLDPLKFKATGAPVPPGNPTNDGNHYWNWFDGNTSGDFPIGAGVGGSVAHDSWDMSWDTPPLGLDNGGNYSYLPGGVMKYIFNNAQAVLLGVSDIEFTVTIPARLYLTSSIGGNGSCSLWIDWTILGGASGSEKIYDGSGTDEVQYEPFAFTVPNVNPGATLTFQLIFKVDVDGQFQSSNSYVYSRYTTNIGGVTQLQEAFFEVTSFKKTVGSIVDFTQYDEFKNWNLLDLLRGLVDMFDLSIQTDPINKVVKMEPTYPYYLNNSASAKINGYFTGSKIDWNSKLDISKESELQLYSDIEQIFNLTFKDDGNDGGIKVFNDRYSQKAGAAKFIFPDRFKTGKKDNENRFFSPTVHYNMQQWVQYNSASKQAPQVIALIPENVSNTSADATENKFNPRVAFCRGVNLSNPNFPNGTFNFEGSLYAVPEMFSVNYNPGGENDPVLSYNDQLINGVLTHGLLRRFFLPRLSVISYGKQRTDWFYITNTDVSNWLHREQIILDNAVYYLYNINSYKPLSTESTQCVLWKYFPVSQSDSDACFPSLSSVGSGVLLPGGKDTVYTKLLLLASDIPQ